MGSFPSKLIKMFNQRAVTNSEANNCRVKFSFVKLCFQRDYIIAYSKLAQLCELKIYGSFFPLFTQNGSVTDGSGFLEGNMNWSYNINIMGMFCKGIHSLIPRDATMTWDPLND